MAERTAAGADELADRNALVEQHLDLVQHVVNQLAARYPRHVDRDELWNAGALGLVDASRRYDASAGVPFARYASIRIRGAIIDATRGRDFSTRSLRRAGRALASATEDLAFEHGRQPDDHELAERLEVDQAQLDELRAGLRRASVLRLDQPTGSDGDDAVTPADLLTELDGLRLPEAALERRELIGTLLTAIAHLPGALSEVVRRYYLEGHLLAEIAVDLGVTEARVSQIRHEGLLALRCYFNQEYDGIAEDVPADAAGRRRRTAFLSSIGDASWSSRVDASRTWAAGQRPAALAG